MAVYARPDDGGLPARDETAASSLSQTASSLSKRARCSSAIFSAAARKAGSSGRSLSSVKKRTIS